jgi:hypothetical protein
LVVALTLLAIPISGVGEVSHPPSTPLRLTRRGCRGCAGRRVFSIFAIHVILMAIALISLEFLLSDL